MNADLILPVADAVRSRFGAALVREFPKSDDAEISRLTTSLIARVRREPGKPHPAMIYDVAFEAARSGDPDAIGVEDDGTEYIADEAWTNAWHSAFAAAVGYAFADELSGEDRATLVRSWESVMGPP